MDNSCVKLKSKLILAEFLLPAQQRRGNIKAIAWGPRSLTLGMWKLNVRDLTKVNQRYFTLSSNEKSATDGWRYWSPAGCLLWVPVKWIAWCDSPMRVVLCRKIHESLFPLRVSIRVECFANFPSKSICRSFIGWTAGLSRRSWFFSAIQSWSYLVICCTARERSRYKVFLVETISNFVKFFGAPYGGDRAGLNC